MNVRRLADGGGTASVPRPPFRWKTRIALPLALLAGVTALLLGSAWRTLFPGRTVRVVPVMVRTVDAAAAAATVTASGWLEPAPFPTFVTALAEGTVEEVSVLEGDVVKKGQVVARLVSEDAELALGRGESEDGFVAERFSLRSRGSGRGKYVRGKRRAERTEGISDTTRRFQPRLKARGYGAADPFCRTSPGRARPDPARRL